MAGKRILTMSVVTTVIACGVLYGQRALVNSTTAAVAAASLSQFADSAEGSGDVLESTIDANRLEIGPVAGLTTAWHRSPAQSAIPLGSTVQFRVFLEPGIPMTWIGAVEVYRDKNKSVASCEFHRIGPAIVRAEVHDAQDGAGLLESVFDVVETAAADITIRSPQVWVNPVVIDENLPEDELNQQTVSYYGGESIAVLRDLGNGQYRTSTRRRVYMRTMADPAGFEPLIEWRLDGEAQALGGSHSEVFFSNAIRHHNVSVGPTNNPVKIGIEIYRVVITGHVPEGDIVPEGVPVTYTAVTDPPGYEEDITWLASTKYGTGVPIVGSGPTFTTQFDNTFGPHPDGGLWQWLGVKGDNFLLGQDQKLTYGVRLENGEPWAFIEVVGGPELIAAPFDPVTEEEDHERARLIGLTVEEMEDLIGQPNDEQIALLQSATVSMAGDLWEGDPPFPDFDGTEGQRRILQTLSAILRLMHLKVTVIDPPWVPNGCTGVPCFLLRTATVACCNAHDACYCAGGKAADRLACDNVFLACIIAGGHPKTALLFYAAVRAFGAPHFNFTC